MSERLELIADQIKNGRGVADVGTDHAYLPCSLLKRGYTGRIIGTDINVGPLNKAKRTLRESGCEDKVGLILCDGLEGVDTSAVDTVVVAGMGGDTVTGILDRAKNRLVPDTRLILQPVTKPEILRYWLINNGFHIVSELHVLENGTLYQTLVAEHGKDVCYLDSELFVGRYELIKDSGFFDRLINTHYKRFRDAVDGLGRTRRSGLEPWIKLLSGVSDELAEMKRRHDEYCK